MLELFPTRRGSRTASWRSAACRRRSSRRALRDAARRLLRGDAAFAGARAARGRRRGRARRLRDEGVPQRRGAAAARARRARSRRRLGGRARVRARGRARRRPSSSCTATTRTTRFSRAAARGGRDGRARRARRGRAARPRAGVGRVLVRVTLGVDADTHEAIRTGHHGSKFGLPPDQARGAARRRARARARRARPARARRLAARRLRRAGARRSSGSALSPPAAATSSDGRRASPTSAAASASATIPTSHVPDAAELAPRPRPRRRGRRSPSGRCPSPTVWLEPGRSLVGRAGVTLYRVGAVKRLAERHVGCDRRRHVRQPATAALRRALHGAAREPRRRARRRDR